MSLPPRECLATVSCDNFLPGTLVMIGSFLRHHPEWNGKVVVIHDDSLSAQSRECLTLAFPTLLFETVSPELTTRLNRLITSYPPLGRRARRFYSFEACRIEADSLLFVDSDVLIRAPLDDLFQRNEPFLAAPDGPAYAGYGRDPRSYDPIPPDQLSDDTIRTPFNSGLMRFTSIRKTQHYAALLAELAPDKWRKSNLKHEDQFVFNRVFANEISALPATDNYLLAHRKLIQKSTGHTFRNARAIHYNNRFKPWETEKLWEQTSRDSSTILTWRLWTEAYFEFIGSLLARGIKIRPQDLP